MIKAQLECGHWLAILPFDCPDSDIPNTGMWTRVPLGNQMTCFICNKVRRVKQPEPAALACS